MTTGHDPNTRIVLSWLREDQHENAERVLLLALDEVDATPQRRSRWPARRTLDMNPTYKYALAAAAVVVIAVAGYSLLPRTGPQAGASQAPTSTPIPSSNPTPTPVVSQGPWVLQLGPLVPHDYYTRPLDPPNGSVTFTFTVPAGWEAFSLGAILPQSGSAGPTGMAIGFGDAPARLYSKPCEAESSFGTAVPGDVIVGPTVEDLASAIQEQTAYEATEPVAVELAGYSGLRMDLQFPAEYGCRSDQFFVWEGSAYAQGPSDRWHIWILDVDGVRALVLARDFAATPAAEQAELMGIIDSLRITP